jgi:hypothetical protein
MFFSETVPWDDEQLPSHRPSTGRRMLRAVVRFSFVFLIAVGTTLGWQSYHGEAKELVRNLGSMAQLGIGTGASHS